MNLALNRRHFLQATSAAAFVPSTLYAGGALRTPLRLAFIGVGGRGHANLRTMTGQKQVDVRVVAMCDVNSRNLTNATRQFPDAKTLADFRQMYAHMADDIDAVVVSTTEHTHAYATLPALRLGKAVYCEKPLTHNIAECRTITDAARQAGVATQMGTQIHGMPNYRRVVELIRSGVIGDVSEVHVWVSRAWGLQSEEDAQRHNDRVVVMDRPQEGMEPPDYLNWDLWLGPAPARPFHEVYFPGPKWYRWWDFGNGTMSDLGSHWNDLPFWALDLDAPKTVAASGPAPHPEIAPASMSATYEYAAKGDRPACTLTWYQGNGVLFVGSGGKLLSDYGKHVLLPEDQFRNTTLPEPWLPVSPGQHLEWLLAARDGSPTSSPFEYSGPLTEANHLGNVAFRAGRKLQWDAAGLRVTNCREADPFIGRTPRPGWVLE